MSFSNLKIMHKNIGEYCPWQRKNCRKFSGFCLFFSLWEGEDFPEKTNGEISS